MSMPMNDEKAEIALQNAVDLIAKIGKTDSGEIVAVSFPEMKALLAATRLVHLFLVSTPYEMVEFEDENEQCGMKMWNRVDIMAAFRRHAKATLTNKCPDCGQPMNTHKEGDHPPNKSLH